MKRIVSLVPSWTETLIEAGANVVGRTRFCIHPSQTGAMAIGGTKSFDEAKLRDLQPDLIIMDREENTKEMFELAQEIATVHVTHVENVAQMPAELRRLAAAIAPTQATEFIARVVVNRPPSDRDVSEKLEAYARRFEVVLNAPRPSAQVNGSFPGLRKTIKGSWSQTKCVYLIWMDPWMCVAPNTFVASMLEQIGITDLWSKPSESKYPRLENVPEDLTVLLSSEPYPFETKTPDLANANVLLVDGESFSWFGLRALKFLEGAKLAPST